MVLIFLLTSSVIPYRMSARPSLIFSFVLPFGKHVVIPSKIQLIREIEKEKPSFVVNFV